MLSPEVSGGVIAIVKRSRGPEGSWVILWVLVRMACLGLPAACLPAGWEHGRFVRITFTSAFYYVFKVYDIKKYNKRDSPLSRA